MKRSSDQRKWYLTRIHRRPPGLKPAETFPDNPSWAKFIDPPSGISYYLSRATGECTYSRPAPPTPQSSTTSSSHPQILGVPPQHGAPPQPQPTSNDSYYANHPNNNIDSSVSHFASVLRGESSESRPTNLGKAGVIPAPPLETRGGERREESDIKAGSSGNIIRDVDMNLFKACRDGANEVKLNNLIGAGSNIEDESYCDVNVNWHANSDGTGWDVIPSSVGKPTSFFWPVKTGGFVNGPRKACNGDTILHIAFKNDERELLKWLCTVRNLDLNVENGEGKTGSSLAEELGKGAMYTFYFVLK
ncbi:hypothetical protein TrLO_g3816 [Triparma laevis f. longispina]|uniref:Uncharacterized protein n=1 Tax=Triparma laevis f. longispina TaxID=1714387 RepID=A0A9W7A1P0_9STRA|nr:hypothetical protein TrLO_g3816 [Triparma laevis f. longispina]